jgi:hypothetical protein
VQQEGRLRVFSILDDTTIGQTLAAREDEVQRMLKERAARRQERRHHPNTWRWRIEPGKEAEFEHLHGWLLSGLREGSRDTAIVTLRAQERVTTTRRLSPVRLGARLAGRAVMRAGRRLLQWGDAADETEASAAQG